MVVIELTYRKKSQQGAASAPGSGGQRRVPAWKLRGPKPLPKVTSFVPVQPWIGTVKKIKPRRIRVMPKSKRSIFDPPEIFYRKKKPRPRTKKLKDVDEVDEEEIKLVLDMSPDGPTFAMLETLMLAARDAAFANGVTGKKKGAYERLTKLLKSGIPGLEEVFDGKGFKGMTADDKQRFIDAVTGEDGKVNSAAAAALIAAATSGGDPEVAEKIIERMMSGLGGEDAEIDPAMMAALMATTAMAAQGASNEEVLRAMQEELANSGLTPEEILAKTVLLQKAMSGDNSPAFINKSLVTGLKAAELTPEDLAKDLAKSLLLQSALAEKGVTGEALADALNQLAMEGKTDLQGLVQRVVGEMASRDGVAQEDVDRAVALAKAMESGDISGLKGLLSLVEGSADLGEGTDAGRLRDLLGSALGAGLLTPEALGGAMLAQRAASALGLDADDLGRSLALQRGLLEGGMPEHEVANAMSLALGLGIQQSAGPAAGKGGGARTEKQIRGLLGDALRELVSDGGVDPDEVEAILDFAGAVLAGDADPARVPPESIRLLKKAMKQRRGSVDNVAETLMATLAATGEDREGIAKAMVKALRATGASPEEIAGLMGQAMGKEGASDEDIVRILASSMAEAGATSDEIAKTVKQALTSAISKNPASAADLIRAVAESLAMSGASADDIGQVMLEALTAGMEAASRQDIDKGSGVGSGVSSDDIMDMVETVAGVLADAGARPEDVEKALKVALGTAGVSNNPELAGELAKTMAKALAAVGASGGDISQCIKDALEEQGFSKDKVAQMTLESIASSGSAPEDIASTLQKLIGESGLSKDEGQKLIIDSMISSGATVEEVGKALAHSGVLSAIGDSPEAVARSLLSSMRSNEDITADTLAKALERGGVDVESAQKAVLFQKALGACGADPEDVAKALLLQKALVSAGMPATIAAKLMREITSKGKLTEAEAEAMLREMAEGELNYDDVMKGLKLDQILSGPEGVDMNLVKDVIVALGKNPSKEALANAANKLAASFGIDAKAASSAAALQKVMAELGLEASDVSKILAVQKKMYESGASPQDIAVTFQAALDSGDEGDDGTMTPEDSKKREDMLQALTSAVLNSGLSAADVAAGSDLAVASALQGLPEEVVKSVALMQKTIEVGLKSPEKMAKDAASRIRAGAGSDAEVSQVLKDLLRENGLDVNDVAESILLQKALSAAGVKPDDLAAVLKIEECMLNAGKSKNEVSKILEELAAKGCSSVKGLAESLLSGMESGGRLRDEDMQNICGLIDALAADGVKDKTVLANLKRDLAGAKRKAAMVDALQKALNDVGVTPETLSKIMLVQKVMAESGAKCSPENLAKVCRLQKSLVEAGLPAGALPRVLTSMLEEEKVSLSDKTRKRLKDVMKSGNLEVTDAMLDFGSAFKEAADPSNQHSEEDVMKALEAGADAAGLTGDDLAKAMLVQKTLAATGVSPEALSQLMLLQKTLAASGKTPEEIAKFLSDAAGGGLSESEMSKIMNSALANPDLTEEDVKNMMKLQESLQKGFSPIQGVSSENVGDILKLQSTLEESGLSQKEVTNLMKKITSGNVSASELGNIMSLVTGGKNIDPTTVEAIMSGKSALLDGSLEGLSVDQGALGKLSDLQDRLMATGATPEEIKFILDKVSSGSLDDTEIKDLMKSIAKKEKPFDLLEKKLVQDLEAVLATDRLKSSGLKTDAVDALVTLSSTLRAAGKTEEEVVKIVSKITSGEMSDSQVKEIMKDLKESKSLPKELKAKLSGLEATLSKSKNLKLTSENDKDVLQDILSLAKTLQESGESVDAINKLVKKGMTSGLNKSDVESVVEKVKSDRRAQADMQEMTIAEKQELAEVEATLKSNKLQSSGLKAEKIDKLLTLVDALSSLGKSEQEIDKIVAKITDGSLSKSEVDDLMSELRSNSDVSKSLKDKLPELENAIKSQSLKVNDEKEREAMNDTLKLAKSLLASGEIVDNVQCLVKKAITDGLSEGEIANAMSTVKSKFKKPPNTKDRNVMEKKFVSDIDAMLKSNRLAESNLDAEAVDTLLTLRSALVGIGKSEEEVELILKDITEGKMSPKQLDEIVKEVEAKKSELPKNLQEKLAKLESDIKSKDLTLKTETDKEALSDVLLLAKTLQACGESTENVKNLVKKALTDGFSSSEAKRVTDKIKETSIPKEIVQKKLAQDLDKLKASGITASDVDALVTLSSALSVCGKDEAEIQKIVEQIASGELSGKEINNLVKDLVENGSLPPSLKDRLPQVVGALQSNTLKEVCAQNKDQLTEVISIAKALGNEGEKNHVRELAEKVKESGMTSSDVDALTNLSKALHQAGKSETEVKKILSQIASGEINEKEIGQLINSLVDNKEVSANLKKKLPQLKRDLDSKSLKEACKNKGNLKDVVELATTLNKLEENENSVRDLMKKAVTEGLDTSDIKAVVQQLSSKPISLDVVEDRVARNLESLLTSSKLKSSGLKAESVNQLLQIVDLLGKTGKTEEEIRQVVEKIAAGNLTSSEVDELIAEISKDQTLAESERRKLSQISDALKSNSLKVTSDQDKEILDDIVLLAKALKASGENNDSIGKLVEKAMTKGLTTGEVANVTSKIKAGVSSSDFQLSQDDVMGAVKKSILATDDKLSQSGVKSDQLESILNLSDVLASTGRSQEEIAKIVQKSAQGTLSKQEKELLTKELAAMAEQAKEAGDADAAKKLRSVCDSIKSDSLKVQGGVDKDFATDLISLSSILQSSGIDEETKRKLIQQKVVEGGVKGEDAGRVLDTIRAKVDDTLREKKQLSSLQSALTSGDLQTVGVKGEAIDKMVDAKDALLAAGMTSDEVASILSKAARGELSQKEVSKIMEKVKSKGASMPAAIKDKLDGVEQTLREGDKVLGDMSEMNEEALKKTIVLAEAMKKSGASHEDVKKVIARATGDGLSEREATDLMKQLTESPKLSAKEKEELRLVNEALSKGQLRACHVGEEAVEASLRLQGMLTDAGLDSDEIGSLMANLTSKSLATEKNIKETIKDVAQKHNLDSAETKKLIEATKAAQQSGGVRSTLELQEALESAGLNSKEVDKLMADIVAKANKAENEAKEAVKDVTQKYGLDDKQAKKLLEATTKAQQEGGVKATLELQKALASAGLNSKEVDAVMADILSKSMAVEEDKKKALKDVAQKHNLDSHQQKMLIKAAENITNAAGVKATLELEKTLSAAGLNSKEIDRTLASIAAKSQQAEQGIKQSVKDIAEKHKLDDKKTTSLLKAVEEARQSGGVKATMELQNALESAGLNSKEVNDIMENIASKSKEIEENIKKSVQDVAKQHNLDSQQTRAILDAVEVARKTGGIKSTSELQNCLASSGLTSSEVSKVLNNIADMASEEDALKFIKDTAKKMNLTDAQTEKLLKAATAAYKDGGIKTTLALEKAMKSAGLNTKDANSILSEIASMSNDLDEAIAATLKGMAKKHNLSQKEEKELLETAQKAEKSGGVSATLELQKSLKAVGLDSKEIGAFVSDIASKDASVEEEVSKAMKDIARKHKLSEQQTKKLLNAAQEAQKNGGVQATLELQDCLKEAGIDSNEMRELVADIASKSASVEDELKKIMKDVAKKHGLSDDQTKTLIEGAEEAQQSGGIQATLDLQQALKNAGVDSKDINNILEGVSSNSEAVNQELKKTIQDIAKKHHLSEEQAKKLLESARDAQKSGGFQATLELQNALKAAGLDSKEIKLALSDVASKAEAAEEEMNKAIDDIAKKHNLSYEQAKKLLESAQKVQNTAGSDAAKMSEEDMKQMAFLQKVLKSTGMSEEKVAEAVSKVLNQGLSKEEIADIIKKAASSKSLSKEDKQKLSKLRTCLENNDLKASSAAAGDTILKAISAQKLMASAGMSEEEIANTLRKVASGDILSEQDVSSLVKEALTNKNVSKEDFDKIEGAIKTLTSGNAKVPGLTPEIMDQVMLLKKTMAASGYSDDEITRVISKATSQSGLSDTTANELISRLMSSENVTAEEKEKLQKLRKDLRDGSMRVGGGSAEELLAGLLAGSDPQALSKALLAQKLLARSGLGQDDLAKVVMLQKELMDSGASPEVIAKAMKETLLKSAQGDADTLNAVLGQMEEDLRAAITEGRGVDGGSFNAADIAGILQFEKTLGASRAAEIAMRKLPPKQKKLLEELIKGQAKGDISGDDALALLKVLKEAAGTALDEVASKSLAVHAVMEKAGASKEEIEEMMAMMMSKGGGISKDFLNNIDQAMTSGGSASEVLELLKDAMEEEMNSVSNCLRNTFLNKIPTEEDVRQTCRTLAEKLSSGNENTKSDAKIALMDVLDEVLQDVMEYEPDADMLYNYLLVAALAESTDDIENNNLKPNEDEMQDLARRKMLDMVKRILLEADLTDELGKLDSYGRSLPGLRELLGLLMRQDGHAGRQLRRQVAFLFDFEEIEHTTVLGLTLRDILRDARQKLRPWELEARSKKKAKGFRWARLPALAYSQAFCFYKVLPERTDGPAIGLAYD